MTELPDLADQLAVELPGVEPLRELLGYSCDMSLLAPTPPDRMVDANGRPYFLWDEDLTLDKFRVRLVDPDLEVRA
jgi:hypothetical protein